VREGGSESKREQKRKGRKETKQANNMTNRYYLPIITHAEINIMFPFHVMSDFPVNIVVGSDESFSDEVHIFLCGLTLCTCEEDFSIDDCSFVVVHSLLVVAKHRTLDRCDGESESGDRKLHG
jgi:hypothetical protein